MTQAIPTVNLNELTLMYGVSERTIRRKLSAAGVFPWVKRPMRYHREVAIAALNDDLDTATNRSATPKKKTKPSPHRRRILNGTPTSLERIQACRGGRS